MVDINQYLNVTEDLKNAVRKSYNKTKEDIQKDIEIIYEWWKKQPHLPMLKDDEFLERFLLRNKFRIEQTKKKLDAYFTLKGLHPEFFPTKTIHSGSRDMQNIRQLYYMFPLKHPYNNERLFFYKMKDPNIDLFDFQFSIIFMYTAIELLSQYDYCTTFRLILDIKDFPFAMFTKMEAGTLIKSLKIFKEGFSGRIAGFEYISVPPFIDMLVKLLALGLKQTKICIYDNMESFYKVVPQKCLPEEYGGEGGKLDDLEDEWYKILDENQDFLIKRFSLISNEKLRIGGSPYSDMFGTDGTFKKINID